MKIHLHFICTEFSGYMENGPCFENIKYELSESSLKNIWTFSDKLLCNLLNKEYPEFNSWTFCRTGLHCNRTFQEIIKEEVKRSFFDPACLMNKMIQKIKYYRSQL